MADKVMMSDQQIAATIQGARALIQIPDALAQLQERLNAKERREAELDALITGKQGEISTQGKTLAANAAQISAQNTVLNEQAALLTEQRETIAGNMKTLAAQEAKRAEFRALAV